MESFDVQPITVPVRNLSRNSELRSILLMAQEKPVTDTCICEIKVDINYIILTEIKINIMVWIYFESNNWSRKFIKDTAWYITCMVFQRKRKKMYISYTPLLYTYMYLVSIQYCEYCCALFIIINFSSTICSYMLTCIWKCNYF